MSKKIDIKEYQARTEDGWLVEYKLQVNTPFQSLGKFYNMILDELRGVGGFALVRINQSLSASPTSAFYGDVAQRKAYAKEQVDKSMQIIGGVVQTVIKLIYSLREFDLILKIFDSLKSKDLTKKFASEQNLKRIFIDEVDIKKGRGSINNLTTAQGMEFVALRDSFMVIKNLKSIGDIKVNDRIKRILKDRYNEFLNWKEAYEKDMRSRKKIQRQYLKSQVESMKMQLEWARPFYTLMQQLKIGTGVANPDLLAGIDTSIIKTKLRGTKGGEGKGKLATAFVDVEFKFKTKPTQVRTEQGQTFHHLFRVEVKYTPYVMPNSIYKKFIEKETMKDIDFLEELIGQSLAAIKDDLEKYMSGKDIAGEEEEKREPLPFEFLFYPIQPLIDFVKGIIKPQKKKSKVQYSLYKLENDLNTLKKEVIDSTFSSYELFKDENSYMTWSPPLA